jgi:hypothetical protein
MLLSGLLFDIKNTPAGNADPQWGERATVCYNRTLLADVRNRLRQPGDNASVAAMAGGMERAAQAARCYTLDR